MSALSTLFEHTSPFTAASGLVRFVELCIDDHGSFRNLSAGFGPTLVDRGQMTGDSEVYARSQEGCRTQSLPAEVKLTRYAIPACLLLLGCLC